MNFIAKRFLSAKKPITYDKSMGSLIGQRVLGNFKIHSEHEHSAVLT